MRESVVICPECDSYVTESSFGEWVCPKCFTDLTEEASNGLLNTDV